MTHILILGNNGMLGHATESIFKSDPDMKVEATSRSGTNANYKYDVLKDDINSLLASVSPDYVINCIGTIKPRIDEVSMDSIASAISINSLFPHRLLQATKHTQTKVIQIATDCVYSGSKGSYVESDIHDAQDVYGKTKSLGEVVYENYLIL